MAKMIINYWGDVMCPFCYIGEHILSSVLEECDFREDIEIRWMSCLLHADKPINEISGFQDHLMEAYDEETAHKKMAVLKHLSEKYGLDFGLDQAKVVNSSDAARVLKWASDQEQTLLVAQALGKAFFSDGQNVADRETLLSVCTNVGLEREKIEEVLNSKSYQSDIDQDQRQASEACPHFIPTIYFNHQYRVEGIITPEQVRESLHLAYQDFIKERDELAKIDTPLMGLDSCGASCENQ